MTKAQKIKRMRQWLTTNHLHLRGGYPYDCVECDGNLFVATLDDGKERNGTLIEVYGLDDMERWYDMAVGYILERELDCGLLGPKQTPEWPEECGLFDSRWVEAFHETASELFKYVRDVKKV